MPPRRRRRGKGKGGTDPSQTDVPAESNTVQLNGQRKTSQTQKPPAPRSFQPPQVRGRQYENFFAGPNPSEQSSMNPKAESYVPTNRRRGAPPSARFGTARSFKPQVEPFQPRWTVGVEEVQKLDEDSDTVSIAPGESMMGDIEIDDEAFLPTFLSRDLGDPLLENQTAPPRPGLARQLQPEDRGWESMAEEIMGESDTNSDDDTSESVCSTDGRPGLGLHRSAYESAQGVPLNMPFDDRKPADETAGQPASKPFLVDSGEVSTGSGSKSGSGRRRSRKRTKKKKDPNVPSWEDFTHLHAEIEAGLTGEGGVSGEPAPAEDDFDAADFSRPSLGNQFITAPAGKRLRKLARVELSDEEMQEKLDNAWDQDMEKKKVIKESRKQQHAEMARRVSEAIQVPMAYPRAKVMIEDCLADFLISEDNEFVFPFMAKFQRVIVHRLANKIGLRTESSGKDGARYTVVSKSKTKTIQVDSKVDAYRALGANLNKRPQDGPGRAGFKGAGGRVGGDRDAKKGQSVYALARARNGDIVGADAEPIGESNIGHALLLKMGWEKGKPLGSSGTGMLEPIQQVVKLSRSGLG